MAGLVVISGLAWLNHAALWLHLLTSRATHTLPVGASSQRGDELRLWDLGSSHCPCTWLAWDSHRMQLGFRDVSTCHVSACILHADVPLATVVDHVAEPVSKRLSQGMIPGGLVHGGHQ
jgi:hypothetical protein